MWQTGPGSKSRVVARIWQTGPGCRSRVLARMWQTGPGFKSRVLAVSVGLRKRAFLAESA